MIISLKLLLSLSVISMATSQGVKDLTLVAESAGEAVVKSSIARIHYSCTFCNDFLFLRRLAYIASNYGESDSTYRPGFHGGIWQISRQNYDLIKTTQVHVTEQVWWNSTTWEDLRKPLYSVFAAMLTLERLGSIPKDVQSQAKVYAKHFSGNEEAFLKNVSAIDTGCGTRAIDVAFVLDTSGNITTDDYAKSKNFAADIVKGFNLGNDTVRVAVMMFSTTATEHISFSDNTNISLNILALPKEDGVTHTHLALSNLRMSVFTGLSGSRKNAAKVAIIQTDGRSTDPNATEIHAALLKQLSGVIVLAIGIGNGTDEAELNNIATAPACTHVRQLDNFNELNSVIADIAETVCTAEIVQNTNTTNVFRCDVPQTIRIDVNMQLSIIIHPAGGNLKIYGSFVTIPSEAYADFSTNAQNGKPSIIYISNSVKTVNKPLYLSTVSDSKNGRKCDTFHFETVPSNSLRKTGATSMCIRNLTFVECSDVDYVKSGSFVEYTGDGLASTICQNKQSSYQKHPESDTKYIYCGPQLNNYIVDCKEGFAYFESQEDCVVPADSTNMCSVCTSDNWNRGFKKFPTIGDEQKYVKCTEPLGCTLDNCGPGYRYLPDDQTCGPLVTTLPQDNHTKPGTAHERSTKKPKRKTNSAALMTTRSLSLFGLICLQYCTTMLY